MGYYLATDVGSLTTGLLALRLAGRGLSVHNSRMVVFAGCAALTLLSIPVALIPGGASGNTSGLLLLGLLLVLGFATLGLFPNYYSFTQDLTSRHQGKVTGMLGFACWMAMYPMQLSVGAYVEATNSYTRVVALGGLPPLAALLVLLLFWKPAPAAKPAADLTSAVGAPLAPANEQIVAGLEAVNPAKS
jgi:ACS family hexuronate transporter-like MFS transporter